MNTTTQPPLQCTVISFIRINQLFPQVQQHQDSPTLPNIYHQKAWGWSATFPHWRRRCLWLCLPCSLVEEPGLSGESGQVHEANRPIVHFIFAMIDNNSMIIIDYIIRTQWSRRTIWWWSVKVTSLSQLTWSSNLWIILASRLGFTGSVITMADLD